MVRPAQLTVRGQEPARHRVVVTRAEVVKADLGIPLPPLILGSEIIGSAQLQHLAVAAVSDHTGNLAIRAEGMRGAALVIMPEVVDLCASPCGNGGDHAPVVA